MTSDRSRYVEKIISRLKSRHKTELRGIVTTHEVTRLCGLIRELLAGRAIDENDRSRLTEYSQLCRCFTVAEANRIAAIHGRVKIKRAKIEKERR